MKTKLIRCEKCCEETIHSVKKVISSARLKIRRNVERCFNCGRTVVKKKNGSYVKKLGGRVTL